MEYDKLGDVEKAMVLLLEYFTEWWIVCQVGPGVSLHESHTAKGISGNIKGEFVITL